MLLVGAGLLTRSFVRLQQVSPGFDPENVVSLRFGPTSQNFVDRTQAIGFYRPFSDALAAVPGVISRGATSSLPFTSSVGWGGINVEGWTPAPGQELQVDQRGATVDYFKTMRIPLLKGRWFADGDLPTDAEPVCIIDEKFAKRFWPNGDAVGKHFGTTRSGRSRSSAWSAPSSSTVSTSTAASSSTGRVERRLAGRANLRRSADGGARHDPHDSRTRQDDDRRGRADDDAAHVGFARPSAVRDDDAGIVCDFRAGPGVVGVYGVLAHLVAQGTQDIGVRMTLGADRSRILRMVLRQGLELAVAGIVLGLAGAMR